MDYKSRILDIAMNLNRVGNWAADDFVGKRKRINFFLDQTNKYLTSVDISQLPQKFKKTFSNFLKDYSLLIEDVKSNPKDALVWAEKMMTWGNILTHRSKLLA